MLADTPVVADGSTVQCTCVLTEGSSEGCYKCFTTSHYVRVNRYRKQYIYHKKTLLYLFYG